MEHNLKILMLEDRYEDVELIERVLRREKITFTGKYVDSRDEFAQALLEFVPDVVLSDHALPQFNSLEALNLCKNMGFSMPFILVTGTVSEEFAVSCLKQGADDYVLKSNLSRLPAAIINSLNKREMEQKRQEAENTLRKQNEELVKINKELDSFVYSVSHNLRAPLMSVLGLLNLVKKDDCDTPEVFLSMMEHSIHKLDDTLKEILDYSRNARNEIVGEEVNVKGLVEDSIERLKYLAGSEKIEKQLDIDGRLLFHTDGSRLAVVFNNLLSNSIKYRDPNKRNQFIYISIGITGESLNIIFSDNGIGIREELIPRIFNMFFRATEKSDGAGLGLYIVKETIEKLGGTIQVKSALGEGTEFNIMLPSFLKNESIPEEIVISGQ